MNKPSKLTGFPSLRNMLDDFWSTDRFFNDDFFRRQRLPAVNIKETDKKFEIEVAAPGFKKEDFKVTVDNGILTIEAETKKEEEQKDKNFTRQEFMFNSFSRSFTLPDNVKDENIAAKYEDGVLRMDVEKNYTEAPKAKKVTVA